MPTYNYQDEKGNSYEVVQKITEEAFKTLAQVKEALGKKATKKDQSTAVKRVINCEGGAIISGGGVYKSGHIPYGNQKSPKLKSGVTRFSVEDLMDEED